MKKRIFFDATPLLDKHISGVGKVLQETLRALDIKYYADKYDMFVFVPLDEYGKAKSRLKYKYIKLRILPFPHKVFSLLTRMKWSPPVDIFLGRGVYIFENFRNLPVWRSKSLTYIHDISFMIYPDFVQEDNLKYLQKNINLWISRTDKIITVSETSRREMLTELGIDNIEVVPNAVDDKEFYPRSQAEIDSIKSKLGIKGDYCVFIGNIEPRKNLVNMVRGFSKFTQFTQTSTNPVSLLLIGGGGWRNEKILKEIEVAKQQGVNIIRPEFYVADEELPAIVTGACSLIQVSWHEGFGLPVLQAIACGTPVVASDIDVLKEVAANNRQVITFCSPNNVNDIAKAINISTQKPRQKIQPQVNSWGRSARALSDIINSLD